MQIAEVYAGVILLIFVISLLLSFFAFSEYNGEKLQDTQWKTELWCNIRNAMLILMGMQSFILFNFLLSYMMSLPFSLMFMTFIASTFLLIEFSFGTFFGLFYLVSGLINLIEKRKTLSEEDL